MTHDRDGFRRIAFDSIDSTNEEARRRVSREEADPTAITVIQAREQTAGRARRGRRWESQPGNLYVSLLLNPACPMAEAPKLGFVAGVALREAVRGLLPPGHAVACKWPNDLMVDGGKVAGILLEGAGQGHSGIDWLIVGTGVNIVHHPEGTDFPATDLATAGGRALSAETVLDAYLAEFGIWLRRWRSEGFAPVRDAWLAGAYGRGGPLTVRLDGATFSGTFSDLDADGALLLDQGAEVRRVTAGDVFFAAA